MTTNEFELKSQLMEAKSEIERLLAWAKDASQVIKLGVQIMTLEQHSQWEGVRFVQENAPDSIATYGMCSDCKQLAPFGLFYVSYYRLCRNCMEKRASAT